MAKKTPHYPPTHPIVCAGTITAIYYPYGLPVAAPNYPNTTPIVCAGTIPTVACHGHVTYPNTGPIVCAGTQRTIPQVAAVANYYQQVQQAQILAQAQAQALVLARAQAQAHAQAIAAMSYCPTVLCPPTGTGVPEDKDASQEKAETKPPVTKKEKKTSTSKKTKKVSKPQKTQKDDLKVIEGIGPKIEQLLNKAGIHTWSDLGAARIGFLRGVLADAGNRYAIHDPKTWARQAKLAAAGNWEKLKAWQEELKGGK